MVMPLTSSAKNCKKCSVLNQKKISRASGKIIGGFLEALIRVPLTFPCDPSLSPGIFQRQSHQIHFEACYYSKMGQYL
uniref:Uncharacterized protein n=1 Tax=Lepeophtheirus salmonis TaxID=72036 RepID=A0A0K2UM24_LEPSM